jgi:hypothetical protein
MEWKQTIFNQLRERNRQERDVYADIVKNCKFSKSEFDKKKSLI